MPRKKKCDDGTNVKRRKFSGAYYAKLRKLREQELQKTLKLEENWESNDDADDGSANVDDASSTSAEDFDAITQTQCDELHADKLDKISDFSIDPALWEPCMSFKMRDTLVSIGPVQLKSKKFPMGHGRRRFASMYYECELPNGEKINRNWLLYSKYKNAVYCFCCKLFSNETPIKQWPTDGFSDWKNITKVLNSHEKSKSHMNCYFKWMELHHFLKNEKTVDSNYRYLVERDKTNFKKLTKKMINIVQFLACQPLIDRNAEDTFHFYKKNCIRITNMLESFNSFESALTKKTIGYFNWNNYKKKYPYGELLNFYNNTIKNAIIASIKRAKYYSIIISHLTDVHDKKRFCLILRFVIKDVTTMKYIPSEHFLCFLPNEKIMEIGLMKVIWNEIKRAGLSTKNILGLECDFPLSIEDTESELYCKLYRKARKVFRMPCACFSQNGLLFNTMIIALEKDVKYFFTLKRLLNFISKSIIRQYLQIAIENVSLKEISFEIFNFEAINVVLSYFLPITNLFMEIVQDNKKSFEIKMELYDLIKEICSKDFIMCVIIWHDVLYKINQFSDYIQDVDSDIGECLNVLEDIIQILNYYKETGYEEVSNKATTILDALENNFKGVSIELISDSSDNLNIFDVVVNAAIKIATENHCYIKKYVSVFGFIHNIQNLKTADVTDVIDIKIRCERMEKALQYKNNCDIDGEDLYNEIRLFIKHYGSEMTALNILNYVYKNDLESIFPNMMIVMRIFYTLPILRINSEGFCSKLDIVRNYLKINDPEICEETIILSIERKLVKSINLDEIADSFVNKYFIHSSI